MERAHVAATKGPGHPVGGGLNADAVISASPCMCRTAVGRVSEPVWIRISSRF